MSCEPSQKQTTGRTSGNTSGPQTTDDAASNTTRPQRRRRNKNRGPRQSPNAGNDTNDTKLPKPAFDRLATPRLHWARKFPKGTLLVRNVDDKFDSVVGYSPRQYAKFLETKYVQPKIDTEQEPLTKAVFHFSDYSRLARSALKNFDIDAEPAIMRTMSIGEIGEMIIRLLTYEELVALGMTRSTLYTLMGTHFEVWDVTGRKFNNQNKCRGPVSNGRVLATVTRCHKLEPNFKGQLHRTLQLIRAIHLNQEGIRELHLHNIPFLSFDLLTTMLDGDNLRHLQYLSIQQCPLLHFGHMVPFLELMISRKQRGHAVERFDFFPRFRDGPKDINREGSYGMTWNDEGIDTDAAIYSAMVYRLLPLAASVPLDISSRRTSFRRWLEKLPLADWSVPRVLGAYSRGLFDNLGGDDEPADGTSVDSLYGQSMAFLFAVLHHEAPQTNPSKATFRACQCRSCLKMYPAFLMQKPAAMTRQCSGCRLVTILNGERDHYLCHQETIVQTIAGCCSDDNAATDNNGSSNMQQHHSLAEMAALADLYKAAASDSGSSSHLTDIQPPFPRTAFEAQQPSTSEEWLALGVFLAKKLDRIRSANTRGDWTPGEIVVFRGLQIVALHKESKWPFMAGVDWLFNSSQTMHPCKRQSNRQQPSGEGSKGSKGSKEGKEGKDQWQLVRTRVYDEEHTLMDAMYVPSADWDKKRGLYKPRPSCNSQSYYSQRRQPTSSTSTRQGGPGHGTGYRTLFGMRQIASWARAPGQAGQ